MTEPGIEPDPTEHERGLALLAEVFSSRVRAVVLGWLVPRMDTPFSLTELSREVDVPISSLQHECYKWERLGVLQGRREGVSRRYRLQHEHQLVRPLVALVIASLGLEAVLTASLSDAGTIGYAVLAGPSRPGEDVLLAIDGDADLAALERAHQRVCLVLGMEPRRIELAYFRSGEHALDVTHPLTVRLAGRPLQAIAGTWPSPAGESAPG